MSKPSLSIEPVLPDEDGGTGDRWAAMVALNGGVADYDASGATIEEALARLVLVLAAEVWHP